MVGCEVVRVRIKFIESCYWEFIINSDGENDLIFSLFIIFVWLILNEDFKD